MISPSERAALFITPPMAPIILLAVSSFPNYTDGFFQSVKIAALLIPIAYIITLFFWLPLYLLAKNRGWLNFWSLSLGTAVVCDISALPLYTFLSGTWEVARVWEIHMLLGITGIFIGAAFWCVLHYWSHLTHHSSGTPDGAP